MRLRKRKMIMMKRPGGKKEGLLLRGSPEVLPLPVRQVPVQVLGTKILLGLPPPVLQVLGMKTMKILLLGVLLFGSSSHYFFGPPRGVGAEHLNDTEAQSSERERERERESERERERV